DPAELSSWLRRFLSLIDAGRLDEIKDDVDRNAARLGAYPRADALIALGRFEEAEQEVSRATPGESNTSGQERGAQLDSLRARVDARLGRREDAERTLAAVMPAAENASGL